VLVISRARAGPLTGLGGQPWTAIETRHARFPARRRAAPRVVPDPRSRSGGAPLRSSGTRSVPCARQLGRPERSSTRRSLARDDWCGAPRGRTRRSPDDAELLHDLEVSAIGPVLDELAIDD